MRPAGRTRKNAAGYRPRRISRPMPFQMPTRLADGLEVESPLSGLRRNTPLQTGSPASNDPLSLNLGCLLCTAEHTPFYAAVNGQLQHRPRCGAYGGAISRHSLCVMCFAVTVWAESDSIFHRVLSAVSKSFDVMYFKIRCVV